jgi:hypothetical protein
MPRSKKERAWVRALKWPFQVVQSSFVLLVALMRALFRPPKIPDPPARNIPVMVQKKR